MIKRTTLLLSIILLLATACTPVEETQPILVSLVADGLERNYEYTIPVTVDEFLQEADIELGELDDVNPPTYTQISNGMRVSVVRVQEERYCEDETIAFTTRRVLNEALEPGQEFLGQAGENGTVQVCYRVYIRDNERQQPIEVGRTPITTPKDEIVYIGPSGEVEDIPINGTLAYLNHANAWIIRSNSRNKQPLTTTGDLDQRVFSLSENGRQLLMTRQKVASGSGSLFSNQLWLLADTTSASEPIQLLPENILFATWVPGRENTISYSTAEPRETAPGWQALNDLWVMRLNPDTGEPISVDEVVENSSFGLYSWWGTGFYWSSDGEQLACVRADSVGLVDFAQKECLPFLQYPVYRTSLPWSWRATVSWSASNDLILTTIHGLPIGSEPPDTSPAFHVAVSDLAGNFQAEMFQNSGIWSNPQYSPLLSSDTSQFPLGYVAFLKCRNFPNCFSNDAEYDLMLADRDGSNARLLFPEQDQPGITQPEFTWSPDGRQIAFIYQRNLWVIDVESRIAHQLTLDAGASKPVWMP